MSCYYFAYGSNMNQERMIARDMGVVEVFAGSLPRLRLAFNKRAADRPEMAYANVVYDADSVVEGVLYRLSSAAEITKMDPYEGAPRYYSREVFSVHTSDGLIPAWVYVANKAMISTGIRPERWYLQHLLAGREFLSADYYRSLQSVICLDDDTCQNEVVL